MGDSVEFSFDFKNNIGTIDKIYNRKNYIIRKSVNLSHKSQIIASNIDLALLIITINNPITSLNFIDRFLIQTEAYGIESILLFNKVDLYDDKSKKKKIKYEKIYKSIGYKTFSTSIYDLKSISKVVKLIKNKVSVFTGHSGVGKSSLINLIDANLNLKTQHISNYHKQGVHTTTYAEMFPLYFGGFIIDTPGIRGLGLVDIDTNILSGYFPEMLQASKKCKFHNCSHVKEPGCNVLKNVLDGIITKSRYNNYLSMLEKNTNYRKNNYEL